MLQLSQNSKVIKYFVSKKWKILNIKYKHQVRHKSFDIKFMQQSKKIDL